MPIRKSTIELPLPGGIDTKNDEKVVQPPSMLDLQNAVFTKHGTVKKRNGYEAYSAKDSDGNTIALKAISTREDELFGVTSEGLYTYVASTDRWYRRGDFQPMGVNSRKVSDHPSSQTKADFDENGELEVYAWEDTRGGVYYSVYDQTSKAILVADTLLSIDALAPRVIATPSSNKIHIVWIDDNANDLKVLTLWAGNLTGEADTMGAATVHANNLLDAEYHPTSGGIVFAYHSTDNTNASITTGYITPDGQFGASGAFGTWVATNTGAVPQTHVSLNTNGPTVVVTWEIPSGAGQMFVYSAIQAGLTWTMIPSAETNCWNSLLGPVVACTAAFRDNTNKFTLIKVTDGTAIHASDYTGVTPDTGVYVLVGGDTYALVGHPLYTRPLTSSDDPSWILPVAYRSYTLFQSSVIFVNPTGDPVARVLPGNSGYTSGHLARPSLTNGLVLEDINKIPVSDEQDNVEFTDPGIMRFEFDFDPVISFAECNGSTYISGGMLWQYDGHSPIEAGFLLIPELYNGATFDIDLLTAGNLDNEKAYFYNMYWEWIDAQGKRLLSASRTFTIGPYDVNRTTPAADRYSTDDVFNFRHGAGSDGVTLWMNYFHLTRKRSFELVSTPRDDVNLLGFRTPGNGVLKYRWVSEVNAGTIFTPDDDTTIVEPDLEGVDRGFTINEYDYQNSGELENVAAYGPYLLLSHDDRIFYVSNADRNKVYFSKRPDANSQPGFNEILYVQLPQDGETITALGVLDNKLVIFKSSKIYMVSGDGPNNLGQGGYTLPRLVSTDTGCKDSRTVVRTPQGLMFQSEKGIYLLNRGESVSYIGSKVEGYNDQTFTAATLLPDRNEVRFLSSDERTLIYDYEYGAWSTFSAHEGLDAVVQNNVYKYVRLDGKVYSETAGSYTDNGTAVKVILETPWLRPSGVQRLWRILRASFLGEFSGDHDMRLKVAVNYRKFDEYSVVWDPGNALSSDVWGDGATWGADEAWGTADSTKPDRVYQFRHMLKTQKVQAVKFILEEIPPGDPTAGFELTSVLLEVGSYQGGFRLSSAKTV